MQTKLRPEEIAIIQNSNLIGFNPLLSTPLITCGEAAKQIKAQQLSDPKQESFFSMIKNTLFPYLSFLSWTSFIIFVNVICYMFTIQFKGVQHTLNEFLSPMDSTLLKFGSNYPYYIRNELQLYRVITSLFLHKNLVSLIISSICLLMVGNALEKSIGWKKFLTIYLVTGMVGNIFGDCYTSQPNFGSATAILGIAGAHFGCIAKNWKNFFLNPSARIQLMYIVVLSVLMNFMLGLGLMRVNTNGHIGGFISGFFLSLWIFVEVARTRFERKCSLVGKIGFWTFSILSVVEFFVQSEPKLY